ncbi:MAG: FtsB family cell division protein [Acidimicrobiales bacterium]
MGQATKAKAGARRLPVVAAAVIALVVVGTSFPAATLLRQRAQLASAATALHMLDRQNKLLAEQQIALKSKPEIEALARQNYQLVLPGQSLYDVLPAAGQSARGRSVASEGDPGNQSPVPPARALQLLPAPSLSRSGAVPSSSPSIKGSGTPGNTGPISPRNGTSAVGGGGGFWHRVSATLEFWR